jgi:hypothetical protein
VPCVPWRGLWPERTPPLLGEARRHQLHPRALHDAFGAQQVNGGAEYDHAGRLVSIQNLDVGANDGNITAFPDGYGALADGAGVLQDA